MHKIQIFLWTICLLYINVGLTLPMNNFRFFLQSVASSYHSNWRENFLINNPNVKNRFKQTKSYKNYHQSDFIYPMILTVGNCLVHRNLKVAQSRSNSSLFYVDILNMEYRELPFDRAYDNRATARIACKYVLQGVRRQLQFNHNYIEHVAELIHIEWMKRNADYASKDLMVPYANLSQIEKDKDRKAFLVACRLFNALNLYNRFNTTPVHLIGSIIE